MDESNLLNETIRMMNAHGHAPADVLFVSDGKNATDWSGFARLANKIYDDGFGSAIVNEDLHVVGADWWLERHEYDGSEWWEYKRCPVKPSGDDAVHIWNYENGKRI